VASYMGGLQNFAIVGVDGPAELEYISRDAKWVAFANVREVMDSELRQKIKEFHPEAAGGPEKLEAETGINIERDVDKIIVSGAGVDPRTDGRPLMLARGRFDQVRLEGLVREHGGTDADYKGKRLFSFTPSNDAPAVAVAFIETDLVAIGTLAAVRGALDTKDGGSNVTQNSEMMRLVRDIDDGNAWAVARFDALASGPGVPQEIAARLPAISWFAVSGHVNGGIRGTVRAEARDEASAENLREVIRGFMALARMQAGQKSEFADLLNSLQLSGQGNSVALDFAVPSELIDALGALQAARPNGFGRPPAPPDAPEAPEAPEAPAPPAPPAPPAI
jgi:hypothetical protein